MFRRKNILCLLLCALLLTSCGQTTDTQESSDVDTAPPALSDTETIEPETDYYAALEEGLDYEGYTFNALWYVNTDWNIYLAPEDTTGEGLNDAARERNLEVEELLNISVTDTTNNNSETAFRNSVMAGEGDTYDLLCFFSPGERSAFITEQLTYDWKTLPYVTLTNPWYNQTANDAYSIGGRQYFAVSDLTFPVQQHFRILFNKELMTEMGLDYPYELVFDGTWTLDALESYCADAYLDVNGDGTADDGDRYGLGFNGAFASAFPLNCGEIQVTSDADGFHLNLYSEKIVSIVEQVLSWKKNGNNYYSTSGNAHYDLFDAGRLLFECYGSDPATLRDIEFDFGYLPYPKQDENQEDYVVWSAGGMMAVPACAADPSRTGAILEALSAGSAKYVKDAFVEQYILNKVLRDEESQKIYRMMRENATYDLSYNLDPAKLLADHKWYSYFFTSDKSISSRWESTREKLENAYADLWDAATKNQ